MHRSSQLSSGTPQDRPFGSVLSLGNRDIFHTRATTVTFKSHQVEPSASQPQKLLKHPRIYLLLLGWYLARCQERQGHLASKRIVFSVPQEGREMYMHALTHRRDLHGKPSAELRNQDKQKGCSYYGYTPNCPLKAGESPSVVRELQYLMMPYSASRFEPSSPRNHSYYRDVQRPVWIPQNRASSPLAAPPSAAALQLWDV